MSSAFIYKWKRGVVLLSLEHGVRVGEYDNADQAYRAWDIYCMKDILPTGNDVTDTDNLVIALWSTAYGKDRNKDKDKQ